MLKCMIQNIKESSKETNLVQNFGDRIRKVVWLQSED